MRTEPTEITLAEYRRLTSGTRTAKRASIPRADAMPRDGLTTLLRAGWSTREDERGAQLYQNWGARLETPWCRSLSEACAAAKELRK